MIALRRKFLSLAIVAFKSADNHCSYDRLKPRLITFNNFATNSALNKNSKMGCPTSKHSKFTVTSSNGSSHANNSPTKNGEVSPKPGETSPEESLQDEYVEEVVCKDSDIGENEMKAFELGEAGKVLLVRQRGKLSALGYKCTHYGAPLEKSALGDGRLRCQWHGACFNIETGDIEDFPGLDSLPCYQVTITDDSDVKVRARRRELETNKRVKAMTKRDNCDTEKIVIIGGGPSGAVCAETVRQEGFKGQLSLICKENYLPYDRVKVSKAMDFEIDKAQFRDEQFYKENDIDVYTGCEATAVNTDSNAVTLSNGTILNYDRLFIATGCKANKLNIPGVDLKNVVILRDYDDAKHVLGLLSEDKEVVVCGASFIAMEAANYCLGKVNKVTLVGRDTVPFRALLGADIGEAFMNLFKEKGVNFMMQSNLQRCIGDGNCNVASVELIDGSILKADIVIMGVGSSFNTEFLNGSGISMRPNGSIETNEYLQTNVPNVFVGGDIAHAPVYAYNNQKSTIGHYPLAHYHGRIAALNMLDKTTPLKAVPFFWTMLFGKGVRYAGHGKYDDIMYSGNVADLKFVAFYLSNDEVIAVSSCGMDPVVSQFAEYTSQGNKLHRQDLTEDPLAWTKLVPAQVILLWSSQLKVLNVLPNMAVDIFSSKTKDANCHGGYLLFVCLTLFVVKTMAEWTGKEL